MGCEDMISALPDDLLVIILSLVPIRDAVATMFLSKRWLSTWTMIHGLEYKDDDADYDTSDDDDSSNDDDNDSSEDWDSSNDDDGDDDSSNDDDNDSSEDWDSSNDDDGDDDSSNDDDSGNDDEANKNEHEDENKNEEVGEDESKKSVWYFLNKSLQLHEAHAIRSFSMKLGRRCPTNADPAKWVAYAVSRCVRELTFKLRWSADPTPLPNSLYSCQSLGALTLSQKVLVDVPCSASLPFLKTLDLNSVVYKDDDSVVRLLSSCPVLERLYVIRNYYTDDNVTTFSVKVPSLLHLEYFNYDAPGDAAYDKYLVIDTPALSRLNLYDIPGEELSTEVPRLDAAFIRLSLFPDDTFLKYLSKVWDLTFYLNENTVVFCTTIQFPRLTQCRICPLESGWTEQVMNLLQNSPNMEYFAVDYEDINQPGDLPFSWNQPSSVPGCLSSQLKFFVLVEYGASEEEDAFLTYVLANSKCLKTATISFGSTIDASLQENIMKSLQDIPRVSTESQLIFRTKT